MKKQIFTLIISLLTIVTMAQDYSVLLETEYWNAAYTGPVTELPSSIKFSSVGYRNGNYITSREMFNFADKDIYIKWYKQNNGQYMRGSIGIFRAGVYANDISDNTAFPNATWLYTRIRVNSSDKSATVVTCTGNYDDAGGTVKKTQPFTVDNDKWHFVTAGTLYFNFADTYNASDYLEIAEVNITNSSPILLQTQKLYDFSDGTIPADFTTSGSWAIDNTESPNGNSMYINGNITNSVSFDVDNADAVIIRYKVSYPGGNSAPVAGTATDLRLDGYMALGVYISGRTSFESDWTEVIIPIDNTKTENIRIAIYTRNGQEIWIDNIEVIEISKAPVIEAAQVFDIDENSALATAVGTVSASDDNTNTTLGYSITSGNDDGMFSINSSTGEITTASAALDYETIQQYVLNIEVSDGTFNDTEDVTININNLNDNAPVIEVAQIFDIDENSATSTSAGTVLASDEDAGATLTYSLVAGPGNTGEFAINSSTGELTNATDALDFETKSSYTLDVEVSDGTLSDTESIVININDVNEAPVVTASQTFSINENSATSTSAGTVLASDEDTGATLTYSLVAGPGNTGEFAINSSTGELTNATDALDFETKSSYTLDVEVSDGTLSDTKSIVININDVNEAPVVTASQTFSINENSATSTSAGTVLASDEDAGTTLTYSLVAGPGNTGEFAINSSTGELTSATDALDFEDKSSYALDVEVSDGTLSDTKSIVININDVNDDAPSITVQPQSIEVCYGEQAILNVTAEGDGTLSYDWLENGVSLGKPNSASLTLEAGEADETANYSCKVTNEFGEVVSLTVSAKMRDLLTVDLGEDVTIATGESVTLDAGAGYSSYLWSDNSDAQTLLVEGSVYGEGTHNISVTVTDDLGCSAFDDINIEVTVTTAIIETSMSDVKIYPNPTTGFVYAEAIGISETLTVEFINLAGQKVLVKQLSGLQSAEKIDITDLKNGMYIVKIYNDNYQKTERIIIR